MLFDLASAGIFCFHQQHNIFNLSIDYLTFNQLSSKVKAGLNLN